MLKRVRSAFAREPIAIFAILVTLVPFSYERIQEVFFATAEIEVECRAPRDDQFSLSDGFLYYETRCLLINKSDRSVSIISMFPTMQSGSHPYILIGGTSGLVQITEVTSPHLHGLVGEMEKEIPININNLEAHAIDVVFTTHVGKVRPYRDRNGCAEDLEFERLSGMTMCFAGSPGSHPAEREREATIKAQIYKGYSYGFFNVDGFGLQMRLGDGRGYIIEADLTLVSGHVCDEEIRQLNCMGPYRADRPKVIPLGTVSPEGRWLSWTDRFSFFIAILVLLYTVAVTISLLIKFLRLVRAKIERGLTRKNETELSENVMPKDEINLSVDLENRKKENGI